jgi:phosphopantothenoylcysteine decarboxylase/phosphopantothenate--cysteine ligase
MGRTAVITCGPAYAPIDAVRRITNFATGEIGTLLAEELASRGWNVVCLRGEGSTAAPPVGVKVASFSTNDSLEKILQGQPRDAAAVFHAAALCDFEVAGISGAEGAKKLSSRSGTIALDLRPAVKVLPKLRGLFPGAKIVGWKFECDGGRHDAIGRGLALHTSFGSTVAQVIEASLAPDGCEATGARSLPQRHCRTVTAAAPAASRRSAGGRCRTTGRRRSRRRRGPR